MGKRNSVTALADSEHKRARNRRGASSCNGGGSGFIERRGEKVACVANCYTALRGHVSWNGVLAFDEFTQSVVKLKAPPYETGATGEWAPADDTYAAIWIARELNFTPGTSTVAEAVEAVARHNPVHAVRDWLGTLPAWDGGQRLDTWLFDHVGVERTAYTRLVGRFFLIGMVKRVMEPGCKFDYCLVLEGTQGKRKSTALSILADPWFGDTDLDLHNKDSMLGLRGKWLYEFAELGALARAEAMRQKSFLSRRFDDFRPPYGRRVIRVPRQVCFAGTTNEWEWNKDPTGGRRFWPVEVGRGEIDTEQLAEIRPQLFAEAFTAYRAGERCWPTSDEQRELFDPQQLRREQQESLVDALHDWAFSQTRAFSLADAALSGLKLDPSKLTRDLQTRVGIALHKLGCSRVDKRNGTVRYWYLPPPGAAAGDGSARISEVDDNEPPPF